MNQQKTKWDERVTVQILTRYRHPYLACLLASLYNQTFKNWDLFILDNNDDEYIISQDHLIMNIITKMQYDKHSVSILRGPMDTRHNIGFSRNILIENDWNPIGCRIDDDSILEPDYLERLHSILIGTPMVAAVGGVVPVYGAPKIMKTPPKTVFNPIRRIEVPKKWLELSKALNIEGFKPDEEYYDIGDPDDGGFVYHPNAILESDHLRSSFMFWNDKMKQIGMHPSSDDTGFREETIVSLRLRDCGYKLMTDTAAICWHLWTPNLGRGGDVRTHQAKILINEIGFQRSYRDLLRRLHGSLGQISSEQDIPKQNKSINKRTKC